ncbi:MAG: hypothetical protein JSS95_03870 [Acidobacteria bacterium]|nr:hypothetical protein [Acidobacteriota bacterium]
MNKPIIITVASLNRDAIYRVTGPLHYASIGGAICKLYSNREMWAVLNALSALPWNRLARSSMGREYANKKLPVTIRTTNPEVIRICMESASWNEPQGEYAVLHHLHERFSFSYQLIEKHEVFDLIETWADLQRA